MIHEPAAGSLLFIYQIAIDLVIVLSIAPGDEEPSALTLWLNGDGKMSLSRSDVDEFKWMLEVSTTCFTCLAAEER